MTDWARQALRLVRRWLPDRAITVVADSTYAALDLLAAGARLTAPITVITRLRLDAALYDPAPVRRPGAKGRPRVKGERQPTLEQRVADPQTAWQTVEVRWYGGGVRPVELSTGAAVWYHPGLPPVAVRWVLLRDPRGQFEPQALLCTDLEQQPLAIVEAFVQRWQREVTFEEARAHLGVETQRQWSDRAIARTTPALFGLFSLVTLLTHHLRPSPLQQKAMVRQAAWYAKERPTFADALALVRRELWPIPILATSPQATGMVEIPQALCDRFVATLAYAA